MVKNKMLVILFALLCLPAFSQDKPATRPVNKEQACEAKCVKQIRCPSGNQRCKNRRKKCMQDCQAQPATR
jgi:hypothetical protein